MQKYFEKIKERLKGLDWVFATYYPDGTEINKRTRKSVAYDDVVESVNQVAEEYKDSEILNLVKMNADFQNAKLEELKKLSEKLTSSDDGWISLPKVAFDRMIARMESESERDIYDEESLFINVRDAARIVREIAGEHKHGHFGCNWNGQHERCKDCGLRGECSHYNTEWFGGKDINVHSNEEFCEWFKYDYRTIAPKNHDVDNPYWRIPEDMSKLRFCPYCGKKIKVVE